jgi:iron complex transport system permease protein
MVLMDDLTRSLISGEIPIGILTSLIGAPFFAWLYKTQKRL